MYIYSQKIMKVAIILIDELLSTEKLSVRSFFLIHEIDSDVDYIYQIC